MAKCTRPFDKVAGISIKACSLGVSAIKNRIKFGLKRAFDDMYTLRRPKLQTPDKNRNAMKDVRRS